LLHYLWLWRSLNTRFDWNYKRYIRYTSMLKI
jgi:hypothetical protein